MSWTWCYLLTGDSSLDFFDESDARPHSLDTKSPPQMWNYRKVMGCKVGEVGKMGEGGKVGKIGNNQKGRRAPLKRHER